MRTVIVSLLVALVLVALGGEGAKLPSTPVPNGWKRVPAKKGEINQAKVVPMTIALKRKNMEKLDKIFWEVSDPRHANYGEHLNNEQMRLLVSPGPQALSAVTGWLRANGIHKNEIARHEDSIAFDATIAQVQALLKVKFAVYESSKTKQRVAKALGVMVVPNEAAEHIELIAGHRGFPLPRSLKRKADVPSKPRLGSDMTNVTPQVLYEAYNVSWFPTTPAGRQNIQSFFQAQAEYVDPQDLSTFCATFLPELGNCSIAKYVNGINDGSEPGTESSLDSEYITAMGRGTTTWVYSYTNQDFCGDLVRWGQDVFGEANGTFPYVISMSYGSQQVPNYCLGPDVDRLSRDVQKMGAMGITVVIASGDYGSGESWSYYNGGLLGASFPAVIPYATSVGSTTFITGNSGQQQATADFGSGGGFSFDFAALEYQQSAVSAFFAQNFSLPPPLSYNASGRGTPDLSLLGDGFFIITGGAWTQVGGTSCSTPSFAGMVSLLNNIRLQVGKTMGFINPFLYMNAQGFTDIIYGNNDVNSDGFGWYCVPGWDPISGLGTPNFGMLAEGVKKLNQKDQMKAVLKGAAIV